MLEAIRPDTGQLTKRNEGKTVLNKLTKIDFRHEHQDHAELVGQLHLIKHCLICILYEKTAEKFCAFGFFRYFCTDLASCAVTAGRVKDIVEKPRGP